MELRSGGGTGTGLLDGRRSHYGFDMNLVKQEVLKVVEEANTYFMQLKISIVVVDLIPTLRNNLSLNMFQEYRSQRKHQLPIHDFASLITFKYAGGLAFVEGMCTDLAVMLCGFYPEEPRVMGSIFFHEVAHLVGVPHREFDHDCTAQQFANVIYKNRCLREVPMKIGSEAICGNGVLEEGEQCDCGLSRNCAVVNCIPTTCQYSMHTAIIYSGPPETCKYGPRRAIPPDTYKYGRIRASTSGMCTSRPVKMLASGGPEYRFDCISSDDDDDEKNTSRIDDYRILPDGFGKNSYLDANFPDIELDISSTPDQSLESMTMTSKSDSSSMSRHEQIPFDDLFAHLRREMNQMRIRDAQILADLHRVETQIQKVKRAQRGDLMPIDSQEV